MPALPEIVEQLRRCLLGRASLTALAGLSLSGGLPAALQEVPKLPAARAAMESPAPSLAEALAAAIEPHFEHGLPRRPHYLEVRDGWLLKTSLRTFRFLNAGLFASLEQPVGEQPEAPLKRIVATIADTRRQLAESGVELLVVPIPMRLNIYPEALVEVQLDEAFRGCGPGLAQLCQDLRAADVEVLELLSPLCAERGDPAGGPDQLVFMRENGHWTPHGLAISAELIAQHVRSRPWFEPLGPADSRLVELRATWKPDGERLPEGVAPPELTFERVLDAAGKPVARTDKTSPVALWGDSFTTIFKAEGADLPRRLNHLLGGPLDVIATLGGGADSTRLNFARRPHAFEGKRLVVWTFSTRSLLAGKWETMRLKRP